MTIRVLLSSITRVLLPLAFVSTFYLYLYPVFHGCAFSSTNGSIIASLRDTIVQHTDTHAYTEQHESGRLAPFRLLVLADPQLEGDSSLPKPEEAFTARLQNHWQTVQESPLRELHTTIYDVLLEISITDIPRALLALRKRIDLFGNDYYLAHIYRTLHWWTKPSHVTVLGDLIGSQWVSDGEFEKRGDRFWNRVFAGGERVDDGITLSTGPMAMDGAAWKNRIINIAGNHDIGYAGDISRGRMERFERVFGRANWDLRFEYPEDKMTGEMRPSLHLVVLNSLVLDTPALDEGIQADTYAYINDVIGNRVQPVDDHTSFTLLLTHLPFYKPEGVCTDAPYWDFWASNDDCGGNCKGGGLKEQNHLSKPVSENGLLESLFGMKGDLDAAASGRGRHGLVLTGHDHEGCDSWHFIGNETTWRKTDDNEDEVDKKTEWSHVRWSDRKKMASHTGVREVTLRSMMGEFAGNAGLLSAWFDYEEEGWQYEIRMCKAGVQHIWWAAHVLDLIAVLLAMMTIALTAYDYLRPVQVKEVKLKVKQVKS